MADETSICVINIVFTLLIPRSQGIVQVQANRRLTIKFTY